jgi:hypothetical protein
MMGNNLEHVGFQEFNPSASERTDGQYYLKRRSGVKPRPKTKIRALSLMTISAAISKTMAVAGSTSSAVRRGHCHVNEVGLAE